MPVLDSVIDTSSDTYQENRSVQLAAVAALNEQLDLVIAGGGQRYTQRHHDRGRLLVRERIELLIDRDAPFMELSPLAAWGTQFNVGAAIVTGVGVVSGVETMIIAHDPTVRGGTMNPFTLKKNLRALEIARVNRLPVVYLVESGGADLPTQSELFVFAGKIFHDLSELSSMGIPTIALVFGNATAGGAYVPGMCDYAVLVDKQAKVFLGGPPLVKMATGEDANDEDLGGADMHSRVSGVADQFAVDENDCIRIGRDIVSHLNWRKFGPAPSAAADDPLYDAEELLGIASGDPRVPFDPRDVIARVADGSRFSEYKPRYGSSLVTGWASIHGFPVGILANHRGVLFSEEAKKATEFILLANQTDTPLIFLHNTTGYMVGTEYEQGGIIKDGSKMINAVTNSKVPHITINVGGSFGAGNYGMSGRAYDPRFMFTWANAKLAVMGAQQLAGVMSIVGKTAAEAAGREFDAEADAARTAAIEQQIESESHPFFISGRLYDDGVIDPRDTRAILAIALSAAHSNHIAGQRGYGVFRM
ncbi:acyl-CoA carboxylase subunit beta (plasmid) [Rhodococcus sp. ZPP]|uniref:acyl-CoA carboxylase subunit beta n=1 Tax=Rhodococcus sp. ZPP TaxID=2749906 RepID=UPI001AD85E5B|nr:carboxyl transferase domain-containing protein [Rhodococcus sp. ZPP]QTJ70119.1 acyl-CoA carboxylase subunit beta [Rhodococcus sp. ZPP]